MSLFLKNAITIFLVRLTFAYPSHHLMSAKYGVKARQILKILKKQYPVLNETLLNIFRNYIPNKKIKCDYRQPPCMNDNIKRKLKQRTKLIKYFYKNGQMKCGYDKILEKSAECSAEIFETKKNYILNMTSKLADSHTAPKTYWTLLNRLLYNKKIPAIPPLLLDGKCVSDFYEKSNIFNNFLHQYVLQKKIQAPCHPFCIEQTPK